jgi:hypothetical protein
MERFLATPAHDEPYAAGHLKRQQQKNLPAVLDSVLTTLQGQGNASKAFPSATDNADVKVFPSLPSAG